MFLKIIKPNILNRTLNFTPNGKLENSLNESIYLNNQNNDRILKNMQPSPPTGISQKESIYLNNKNNDHIINNMQPTTPSRNSINRSESSSIFTNNSQNKLYLIHPIIAILDSKSERRLTKTIQYFVHLCLQLVLVNEISKFDFDPFLIVFGTLLFSSTLGYIIGFSLKKFSGHEKDISFKKFFVIICSIYLFFCVVPFFSQQKVLEFYEMTALIMMTIVVDLLILDLLTVLLCKLNKKFFLFFKLRGFANDKKHNIR
jgi:hypothetical protein